MYIVGGSIPEICDDNVYNTCTVWDPNGNMIAKHRKVLFKFDTIMEPNIEIDQYCH